MPRTGGEKGGGARRRGPECRQDHEGQGDQSDSPHQDRCAPDGQTAEQDAPTRLGARHVLVVGIVPDPLKASPRVVLLAEGVVAQSVDVSCRTTEQNPQMEQQDSGEQQDSEEHQDSGQMRQRRTTGHRGTTGHRDERHRGEESYRHQAGEWMHVPVHGESSSRARRATTVQVRSAAAPHLTRRAGTPRIVVGAPANSTGRAPRVVTCRSACR